MHVYTTHTCSQLPVDSCKNSTRTQLGLSLHTPQYTCTFTTTYPSKNESLQMQATLSNLKWHPPVAYIKLSMPEIHADSNPSIYASHQWKK